MRIAAQNINKRGYIIKKKKLNEVYQKYVRQYNKYCEKIYDAGYITTPYYFNEKEFWGSFLSEFGNSYFLNERTGDLDLSKKRISYTIKLSDDMDLKCILDYVRNVLDAIQAIKDFEELLKHIKIPKKSSDIIINSAFIVSRCVYNNNKLPLDSPFIQECFYIEEGKVLDEIDYSHILLDNVTVKLGIEPSTDNSSIYLGDGFTKADDCYYMDLLLSGAIRGRGKYGKQLYDFVENYYQEYYATRTTKSDCLSFESENFIECTQKCIDFVEKYRGSREGYDDFLVTSHSVVFISSNIGVSPSAEYNKRTIYIGTKLIDYCDYLPLDVYNRLHGWSGEFVAESDLDKYGYKTFGLPIKLYYCDTESKKFSLIYENFYALPSVKLVKDEDIIELYPNLCVDDIKYLSVEDTCRKLEVKRIEDISKEIAKVLNSGNLGYDLLIGRLVQGLICIECDYIAEGHTCTNQVFIPDEIDELDNDTFDNACIEAQSIFRKLGF